MTDADKAMDAAITAVHTKAVAFVRDLVRTAEGEEARTRAVVTAWKENPVAMFDTQNDRMARRQFEAAQTARNKAAATLLIMRYIAAVVEGKPNE